jgi:transposase InsO family protein
MDFKLRFVSDYLAQHYTSFRELCERYGISTRTGYKYVQRYDLEGVDGLKEHSRRPQNIPNKMPQEVEDAFVELRKKHMDRGAKKLVVEYAKKYPSLIVPCVSTISNIISRNGLVSQQHKRRNRQQHPGRPHANVSTSNQLWAIDFKGQFKMRNGEYCYPLTLTDSYSRYLLTCKGLLSPNLEDTKKELIKVFKEYGLPQRIRSDNGAPFSAPLALGRLSRLSVWLIRLGIFPELIEPGKPQQNSRHERMHKDLKAKTTRPPGANLSSQQRMFNGFLADHNFDRPHEALGQVTPASLYTPSTIEFPSTLPQVYYPGHFEVRRVSRNCGIRWRHQWVRAGLPLAEQYIGFEEIGDGIYNVYFGFVLIGRFDERQQYIETFRSNIRFDFD